MTSPRIHTTLPGLSLRQATRADAALVLDFIHRLAAYEKLSHEVEATVADIEDALFGARPFAEAVIAELDAAPAGFILWFPTYSTFVGKPGIYLEDLYIRPAFRGQGCGKALLKTVARLAVERGCGRFEWSVLDWNQRAIDFYHSIGAKPMSDWTMMRVTGKALEELGEKRE